MENYNAERDDLINFELGIEENLGKLAVSIIMLVRDILIEAKAKGLEKGYINSRGLKKTYELGKLRRGSHDGIDYFLLGNSRYFDYDEEVNSNHDSASAFKIENDELLVTLNFSCETSYIDGGDGVSDRVIKDGGKFAYSDVDVELLNRLLEMFDITASLDSYRESIEGGWASINHCILELRYNLSKEKSKRGK